MSAEIAGASNFSSPGWILDKLTTGFMAIDRDYVIICFNRAAERITKIARHNAINRSCLELFNSELCNIGQALRQTIESGKEMEECSGYVVNAKLTPVPVTFCTGLLLDESGRLLGVTAKFRELKNSSSHQSHDGNVIELGDLTSRSPLMAEIFSLIPAVAASLSTVLIQGEIGTGKELVARTIHTLSPRRNRPFVAVSCAALPDTLLGSELFGDKTGAFAGAARDKPERFALARGGTIFLDEVDEIHPELQVKLLRILQNTAHEAPGATGSESPDVRIIAASNRDLAQQVRDKLFRNDLYYHLNVMKIELPPLRNRKTDLTILAGRFIRRFNTQQGKNIRGIAPDALSIFMAYDWPGNVRELENVIERAFILCSEGYIEMRHLPAELIPRKSIDLPAAGTTLDSASAVVNRQTIMAALENHGYNRTATARQLGVHVTTLFRKMKKLGISTP